MILLTGFQGYAGRSLNPAEAVVRALDGTDIGGMTVHGRVLPVDFHAVARDVPGMIDALAPKIVVSLGLWPGEPMIRLERVAANWAQFELPDAVGHRQVGPVVQGGADGYLSSLPHDAIQSALRAQGIPCRQSGSAGTYLCNALSYIVLHHCAHHHPGTRAGFIHLPYLPVQVAQMLDDIAAEERLEQHQRADYASMSLEPMIEAVKIALTIGAEGVA
ncbi:MAG: hypothetical protein Q7J57_07295 [Gemmobacter sp.]|nr:hypothetical protein [Gemmobacter sp.]